MALVCGMGTTAGAQASPSGHGVASQSARHEESVHRSAADGPRTANARAVNGADARRAVPSYDGRAAVSNPDETWIWIPRVLLAPLWLVSEYVIRQPLRLLVRGLESVPVDPVVIDLFTWDNRNAGLVPTALWDFGLLPSGGLFFFWNDLGAEGHALRASASFGGVDYVVASAWDRTLLSSAGRWELTLRGDVSRRPDHAFQGLGWDSDARNRARFRRTTFEGLVGLRMHPWRRSEISTAVAVSSNDLSADGYGQASDDPSVQEAVANGSLPGLPPGLAEGYDAYRQRLRIRVDSRGGPPGEQSGLRVDLIGELAFDLARPTESRWARYGGTVVAYLDAGNERVFSFHLMTELVYPFGASPIPFTEQVRLGGAVLRLAGFLPGQLVGESALVASIRYRYPIWAHADASVFISSGNVFGEHLQDFDITRVRLAWGLSLQTTGDLDHGLRFTLAAGTEPYVRDFAVTSFRLLLGGEVADF